MIFSSYPFLFLFLPAVLLAATAARTWLGARPAIFVLTAASLFFYAYWDWRFVGVIVASIVGNYLAGCLVAATSDPRRRFLMTAGAVAANILVLAYFKYTNFFLANMAALIGRDVELLHIILPLGISFFTFTQIAYLVDVYRRQADEPNFLNYTLFVTFFPHLIAGPILHHREIMPQFLDGRAGRASADELAQGTAIFVVGLAKKVLIADEIARFATPVFTAAASGTPIPLLEAWGGTLAYAFQIYFDFSAYSDMAVGLGLMFGVRLPQNFASPYKASSLIEFWRRWHMTLSRFLRDYLYFPLGGNRRGGIRRYANLLAVMVIGGFWHGAAWTFVLWGALHGIGLVINHLWRACWPGAKEPCACRHLVGMTITFLFVALAWVPFRAEDFPTTLNMFAGLAGLNGIVLPETYFRYLGPLAPWLAEQGVRFEAGYLFLGLPQLGWLAALLLIVWTLPNTLEWARYRTALTTETGWFDRWLAWRPTSAWSIILGAVTIIGLVYMGRPSEFLYFQF